MRHYEIMANGCIPYFPDIANCPPNTMALCPKSLFIKGNVLYDRFKKKQIGELTPAEKEECENHIHELLEFMRDILTTEKIAEYILRTIQQMDAKKILFLSGNMGPDYLRCLVLHGFKMLLKSDCHDYPVIPHIYYSNIKNLYGKGFSYSNLLDPEIYYNINGDDTVLDDIRNKKYDIVIYGSFTRGMPLYDVVREHYPPEKIILLFGEDETIYHFSHIYRDPLNPLFIREW
jgi:hypothetical protein